LIQSVFDSINNFNLINYYKIIFIIIKKTSIIDFIYLFIFLLSSCKFF